MPPKKKAQAAPVLPQKAGIVYSDIQRSQFPTEEQYVSEEDGDQGAHIAPRSRWRQARLARPQLRRPAARRKHHRAADNDNTQRRPCDGVFF